ncbi:MAG: HAD family phosphatase [Spirochaetales bacterium]|uniref:HAD family phosphatase n=1 Tax=Candidatus Thalassospirochaeta sargassi TaxID=3119039 RepID=A0AAJ1MI85_9SPIO|nr:HAD family phosphatase [Spirochaetales bacterium]
MNYKGIILDFNGTLIWDTLLHKEAWLTFSRELGTPVTEKQYYNDVHGKSTRNILEMLFDRKIEESELARLSDHKEALYRDACLENPDVYCFAPGVEDFLDYLTDKDIPRTIATASEKVNVDFFVETLKLNRWFNPDLFTYDDGSLAIKPAPDLYLKAAERLNLKPSQLVIVEDTYYGALSAKNAGAGCLIITGPADDRHDELDQLEGVNQFISDFAEIDKSLFYA